VRENRTPGSARGLVGNGESYLNAENMKKLILIILPGILYFAVLLSVPGAYEYFQIRYNKGWSSEQVEASIAAMHATLDAFDQEFSISTHISAEDFRNMDREKINRFFSDLNRMMNVEQEAAALRTLYFYTVLKHPDDMGTIESALLRELAIDYQRLVRNEYSSKTIRREFEDKIAEDPTFAEAIGASGANQTR
jgi:hypothetical protein